MDDIPLFPGVDKVVHFCMYGGMSGMLWLEFLRNHRKYETVLWHAWIGAVLCPIVMSGIIEILQEYCTTYRGGDWFDFLANTCGVIAATAFAWWKGIPSSSSHTLIGGFAGAAIMAHGFEAIQLNIILKIAAFIFLAPFIGMIVAFGFTLLVLHMCKRVHPHTAEVWFKKLQLVSSALFSIGHGLNDSQKVMGIIAAALIAAHSEGLGMGINSISDLPDWVAFSCFTAISLGTMSGGWKIVKTMGTKITKVTPLEGVIAETAGAFTLYLTEFLKIPVSTTHTITGAIIGVGATKRLSAVRWGVTQSLMTAWVLTIPVSGLLAAGIYYMASLLFI